MTAASRSMREQGLGIRKHRYRNEKHRDEIVARLVGQGYAEQQKQSGDLLVNSYRASRRFVSWRDSIRKPKAAKPKVAKPKVSKPRAHKRYKPMCIAERDLVIARLVDRKFVRVHGEELEAGQFRSEEPGLIQWVEH